jgi:hypothetical protein
MDARRFEHLIRAFVAAASRRRILRGLLPLLSAGMSVALGDSVAAKNKRKRKHRKKPPALNPAFACPAPPEGEGAGTRIGQVFTATRSGTLRQIRVGIVKPPGTTGDYVVQLLAASGSPAIPDPSALGVLAAVVIPDASVSDGLTTLVANFAGTELVQGTDYAVVVGRRGGNALVQSHIGDRCAGALVHAPDAEGPFSVNNNSDAAVSVLVA